LASRITISISSGLPPLAPQTVQNALSGLSKLPGLSVEIQACREYAPLHTAKRRLA
jgi:hypothetical protein